MKKCICIIIILIMVCLLTACGNRMKEAFETSMEPLPEFSDRYLVSSNYGGGGWGDFYDCISGQVRLCKNGTIEFYMPEYDGRIMTGMVLVDTLPVDPEKYAKVEKSIDLEELYTLDPELDENVCDGYSRTLTVYGKDDHVLKVCGGYMPCNKRFNEMYQIVNECYPKEELSALYDAWIEALKKENNF